MEIELIMSGETFYTRSEKRKSDMLTLNCILLKSVVILMMHFNWEYNAIIRQLYLSFHIKLINGSIELNKLFNVIHGTDDQQIFFSLSIKK